MRRKLTFNLKAMLTLLFSVGILSISAQNITVKGTVTEASNKEPIIGATIVLKGAASHGTVTDYDGNYSLSNVPANGTLEISYVGMASQTISVDGRTTINISMSEDSELLDEVVVTALGISRDKKSLGYAVSSIKGTELTVAGVPSNPLASIYGKAAGVGLSASAAGPTGGINIKVRGATQLETSSSTRPLFVVDGVPIFDRETSMATRGYDPFNSFDYGAGINDINAEDIESMEILKVPKLQFFTVVQGLMVLY